MRPWNAIAICAVVLTAVINVVFTVRRVAPPSRSGVVAANDSAMREERRLAVLRRVLAERDIRGRIGYLADVPAEQLAADPGAMRDFFLGQFVLVPCVLDTSYDTCRWVVANLRTTTVVNRMPAGFRAVEDCGDGVWLLEKVVP